MEAKTIKRSRIGKLPVTLPSGVDVQVVEQNVKVKGPRGELQRSIPAGVTLTREGTHLLVVPDGDDRDSRAVHGLVRSLVANMVKGVSQGYERVLEINGIGYRAELRGKRFLLFFLGYSHPIIYELPVGVAVEVGKKDNTVLLKLSSIDKELLGHVAAKMRSFRKPEPYKGKGIKYAEEVITIKAGKSSGR